MRCLTELMRLDELEQVTGLFANTRVSRYPALVEESLSFGSGVRRFNSNSEDGVSYYEVIRDVGAGTAKLAKIDIEEGSVFDLGELYVPCTSLPDRFSTDGVVWN